jgi:hypothetical protein
MGIEEVSGPLHSHPVVDDDVAAAGQHIHIGHVVAGGAVLRRPDVTVVEPGCPSERSEVDIIANEIPVARMITTQEPGYLKDRGLAASHPLTLPARRIRTTLTMMSQSQNNT